MTMLLQAQLPVLPVLVPLAAAVLLLLHGDGLAPGGRGAAALLRVRALSLASLLLGGAVSLALVLAADTGELLVYRVGDWPAPFGITLVIDRLSALMLLLTQAVALPVWLYAAGGADAQGRHFHALLQFQLMGLAGAFSTGDLFNLFVFFEVLLIASYVLLAHGLGRERLRRALPYVVLNLIASALFLIGVAVVYAVAGTLNLADLALRAPRWAGADAALLHAGALLLLVVFGFKAALLPLHLWLPATYAAACAPVAALFALMTKVGLYSIVRVHGAVLGDAAAAVVAPWLLPMALATCLFGVLGALASQTLARLVAWLNIVSVGTIALALAMFSHGGWSAAIYYLTHSTLVVAALFLLIELIAAQRGSAGSRIEPAAPVAQPLLLGVLLLLGAASIAGLPPLPGFIGKLMILQAAASGATAAWVWTVVLAAGLGSLIVLARAGSVVFWSARPADTARAEPAPAASTGALAAALLLVAAGVALAATAGPVQRYTDAAAAQLFDRAGYARAVLGDGPHDTVRPYHGGGGR